MQKSKNVFLPLYGCSAEKKLTHGTVGSNKRSVKTGSTKEETFPGQADKTSSTFFPLPEIYWKDGQSVKNTLKDTPPPKILLLFNGSFDKMGAERSHTAYLVSFRP